LQECRLAFRGATKYVNAATFLPNQLKQRASESGGNRQHRQGMAACQRAYAVLPIIERSAQGRTPMHPG
jgi:hypothetical protein